MSLKRLIIKDNKDLQGNVLWADIKAGNMAAFDNLYNTYADDLLRYGCHLVRDKYLVEDTIHDIFVSIWEQKEKMADVRSIRFYLLTALRRSLHRKIKKESMWQLVDYRNEMCGISPSFIDVASQLQDESAMIEKVRKALDKLSSRQKEIIYLKFYQNLSYQEISDLMGLDQKYTYNLASRAFCSFKEQFVKAGLVVLLLLQG
jgi:RNA polymerase sigma factor (sigma-70 family)